MKLILLFIAVFLFTDCFSQKTFIYKIAPNWDNFSSDILKGQYIRSDSVYFYKKRKNNKDSAIVMTQYFDSLGNLIERDEYNFIGKLFRITNYTYIDTVLLKQETVSKDIVNMSNINGPNSSKKVRTYEQNSIGNIIVIKEYSFFGDSLKSPSTTIWHREYDNSNHITREFLTLPKGESYLRHTYIYTNGILTEIKSYAANKNWIYSYLYEFDEKTKVKSAYLYNSTKTLSHEFFYDDHDKLIKEQDYEQGRVFKDHITQTYSYEPNGLLVRQSFEDLKGESYYYRHFYSK